MSSGDQGTKQDSLEEYEKNYLERLEKEKKSENLQDTIFHMTQEIKKHETKDYLGFCVFCNMGVTREEMAYKNNLLFHSNCFEQQGKNFPPVNEELQKQTTNAKVQLVLLKNLKARTSGTSNVPNPQSRPKPKKRSKPKRKTKKKRKAKRKRPARRKVRRKSKRRPTKRRRKATKRRKSKRTSRRKPARRRARPKARRRTKRSSSRRRRR